MLIILVWAILEFSPSFLPIRLPCRSGSVIFTTLLKVLACVVQRTDNSMAWNIVLCLLSALTLVMAFPVYDGCVVQNGLNLPLKGLAVNLTARASDPIMNVSLNNQNTQQWTSSYTKLEESKWMPITLNVYPTIELKVGGQRVLGKGRSIVVSPTLEIEGALLMANCPEGRPIYQLSEAFSEVRIAVGDGDEVMFLSPWNGNRSVNLLLDQEDQELKLTWNNENVTLETSQNMTFNFKDPFSMTFNFSQEAYKITVGNQLEIHEVWKSGYQELLHVAVKMDESDEPLFVSTPRMAGSKLPRGTTTTEPSSVLTKSSMVVNSLVATLTTAVILLVFCLIVNFLLLYPQYRQWCGCMTCLPETLKKQEDGGVRTKKYKDHQTTDSRPVTPPRPENYAMTGRLGTTYHDEVKEDNMKMNFSSCPYNSPTQRSGAGNDLDDEDENSMYVKANEVKPFEVLLMEDKFTGRVNINASPYEAPTATTPAPAPNPYAPSYNLSTAHGTSAGPAMSYSNNDESEPNYINVYQGYPYEEESLYLSVDHS